MLDLQRLRVGRSETGLVYITDRYQHILLTGKSGSGKTSLLTSWLQTDFLFKPALVLIDPSGFLAQDGYSLSKGKARYCSLSTPVSINPMQAPYDPNTISDIISEAINQVVAILTPNQNFTVKMRDILDEAVKWCLKNNRRNLIHVRDYILNQKGDAQTRDGILSRLNFLLNDKRMVPILCGNNTVNWGELIFKREAFILDCFGMSEEKMIFAGNIISQGIKNYFRHEKPREYRPLAFYVDEAHNFINENFFSILKEGRKFRLSTILATQDFALINEKMVRVMLNVGNIVSFKMGHREARYIAPEMGMRAEDLQFLEKYHLAYMIPKETGIAKAPAPPFIKRIEIKRVETQFESKGWFKLQSFQPA
jgi:hypothetical protein